MTVDTEGRFFDREFKVWAHTVSRSQLLLRSPKGALPTRVDIGFSGVSFVMLRSQHSQLRLRRASAGEAERLADWLLPTDGDLYAVESDGRVGFVAATSLAVSEDEGEFADVSEVFTPAGPYAGLIDPSAWPSPAEARESQHRWS